MNKSVSVTVYSICMSGTLFQRKHGSSFLNVVRYASFILKPHNTK